ncbi:TPA: hypothetical protein ACUODX_002025 [Streptococcus pneumoniae]
MKKIATAMNVSVSDLFTQDTPIKKNRHSTPVNPKIEIRETNVFGGGK